LTPYEEEYGYSKKIQPLPQISHFSTFVKHDDSEEDISNSLMIDNV